MDSEVKMDESDYKYVAKKILEDMLLSEFDQRRWDDLHWGVYRINDEGEIYPTPFVQCHTLGHALIRYATDYVKKGGTYAVAPIMTDEELKTALRKVTIGLGKFFEEIYPE